MQSESANHRARTKIVATVGPACANEEELASMILSGVDVFRINTAHGEPADHTAVLSLIRHLEEKCGRPLGVLVDLAGPKIRLGGLVEDPINCNEGDKFELIRGYQATSREHLVSNYPKLIDELTVGDRVLLADGTVAMVVVNHEPESVMLEVTDGGILRSRQGINLPGVNLSVDSPSDRDLNFARWATELNVDYLGLSFVRSPEEIKRLRHAIEAAASDGSPPMIIAKIEKLEALERLTEIVAESDGVMVARGDLGVEIDVSKIAAVQKRIIATCNSQQKPVIVATQMLESMTHSPRPTRAEATDVANAILDGADACMLSGETAIGEHPATTVEMMNRIALSTEPLLADLQLARPTSLEGFEARPITVALVHAANELAELLKAQMIVVATRSGGTAIATAKQRSLTPTIGVSSNLKALRRLCLLGGVTPLAGAPLGSVNELATFIEDWGKNEGTLSTGDRVIFVCGTGYLEITHNQMLVHEVS